MSYDIEVFTRNIHFDENYTSNVGDMYHAAYAIAVERERHMKNNNEIPYRELIYDDFKDALNSGRDSALRALTLMLKELKEHSDIYINMNPKNGWGNYEGAVNFLEGTLTALTLYKDSEVRIDA